MYAVVQIGSRIRRSECITALIVCACAAPVPSTPAPNAVVAPTPSAAVIPSHVLRNIVLPPRG
jgi:hypothetical protein